MSNTRPPTLQATVVQMPQGHFAKIRPTYHPRNPHGHTLTLTVTLPITLEISIRPEDLHLLKAA